MVKYTLIIEYLSKENNFSQVATLCDCSRTTVWQVLQCIDFLSISLDEIKEMKEEELRFLLFPERIDNVCDASAGIWNGCENDV